MPQRRVGAVAKHSHDYLCQPEGGRFQMPTPYMCCYAARTA